MEDGVNWRRDAMHREKFGIDVFQHAVKGASASQWSSGELYQPPLMSGACPWR